MGLVCTRRKHFMFAVNAPELWSPDFPNLYGLVLKLYGDNTETDRITKQVGIREFRIDGNRFLLNGRDIYLKGVCRHEMWGEQGFTEGNYF